MFGIFKLVLSWHQIAYNIISKSVHSDNDYHPILSRIPINYLVLQRSSKENLVLDSYYKQAKEREQIGVVPKPLSAEQVEELIEVLQNPQETP